MRYRVRGEKSLCRGLYSVINCKLEEGDKLFFTLSNQISLLIVISQGLEKEDIKVEKRIAKFEKNLKKRA